MYSSVRPSRAWSTANYETDFKTALDKIKAAWLRTRPSNEPYKRVGVFSMTFSNDDINVGPPEAALLKIFQEQYGFDIVRYVIDVDSDSYYRDVLDAIGSFVKKYNHEHNMMILYYSGHAEQAQVGTSINLYGSYETLRRRIKSVSYSHLEPSFINLKAQTLFFLDCCHAGQVAAGIDAAAHEMICASGWESPAGGEPTDCWTYKLIEHLTNLGGKAQTVAQIHANIFVLATSASGYLAGTPVYVPATDRNSITLRPMVKPHLRSLQAGDTPSKGAVLLSIHFKGVLGMPDVKEWDRWLAAAPPEIRSINIEAQFPSNSTILLLRIPWIVWLQLEEHSAWHYIAQVPSTNPSSEVALPLRPLQPQNLQENIPPRGQGGGRGSGAGAQQGFSEKGFRGGRGGYGSGRGGRGERGGRGGAI